MTLFWLIIYLLEFSALGKDDSASLQQSKSTELRREIEPILREYCQDACKVLRVEPTFEEKIEPNADLGFEGLGENSFETISEVSEVKLVIETDERVRVQSREKLEKILFNHFGGEKYLLKIEWVQLVAPEIGGGASLRDALRDVLETRIRASLEEVRQAYCGDQCFIADIDIQGSTISEDEAEKLNPKEVYRSTKAPIGIFHMEEVRIALSIDQSLPLEARERIIGLMRSKMKPYLNVVFDVDTTLFPESFSDIKEKQRLASEDPHGLSKLRQTLEIFRELAGTKEIITNSKESLNSKESSASKEALNQTTKDSNTESSSASTAADQEASQRYFLQILIFLAVAGGIAFILLRFSKSNKDAAFMMGAVPERPAVPGVGAHTEANANAPEKLNPAIKQKLIIQDLKEELIETFMDNPRVSKETFMRLLQDEGIEATARYVHIFGKMIVFELLSDPSIHRRLYELSEYYHRSRFDFSLDEEERLLRDLKTRVTASEIRVLTRTNADQFEFINRLDPAQIFNLIKDESAQLQSVVMTQLGPKLRRIVFDFYDGALKIELLRQLSAADAIPKEYLANIAKSLRKKISTKPEFDTESLRSSDILLDLLEKASLEEQKALMDTLAASNQDAARGVKTRLVSIHMLPYLKDGHLLELVLGLNQSDLTVFLKGAPEHIGRLLITRAPRELADSWLEELSSMAHVDEAKYRIVEIQVLGKIRQLASNGSISLLEINEIIFPKADVASAQEETSPFAQNADQYVA